jgi:hypothetical protein
MYTKIRDRKSRHFDTRPLPLKVGSRSVTVNDGACKRTLLEAATDSFRGRALCAWPLFQKVPALHVCGLA